MNWNRTKYKYTSGKELHSISNLKWGYAIEKIVRIKILEPFRKNRDTEAYCGVSEDSPQKHFAATYQLRVAEKKGFMRYLSQSDDELMSLFMLLQNGTAKITNKLPSRRMCYRFGQKAERTWIGCKEGFPPRPTNKSYLDISHKTVSLFFIYQ